MENVSIVNINGHDYFQTSFDPRTFKMAQNTPTYIYYIYYIILLIGIV